MHKKGILAFILVLAAMLTDSHRTRSGGPIRYPVV